MILGNRLIKLMKPVDLLKGAIAPAMVSGSLGYVFGDPLYGMICGALGSALCNLGEAVVKEYKSLKDQETPKPKSRYRIIKMDEIIAESENENKEN